MITSSDYSETECQLALPTCLAVNDVSRYAPSSYASVRKKGYNQSVCCLAVQLKYYKTFN